MEQKKNGKNGNGHLNPLTPFEPFSGLDDIDIKLIEMKVENPGMPQKEMHKAVNLTKGAVFYRVNKPEFQRTLSELRKEAFEMIQNAKLKAAKVILNLMDNPDPDVSFRAAQAVLADYLPARQVNISGAIAHVHFEAEQAQETLVDKLDRIEAGNLKEQRN